MNKYYIHSNCCNAHWELVVNEYDNPELQCEKCGKANESGILLQFTENIIEGKENNG